MAQIKFLKKNNNSTVNTDNGDIFYPVTVSNAVYITESKTIDEVIGESIDNKSIYQWIKLLETKSKYVLSVDNFQENYLPLINNIQNKIPQLENYLESLNNNILNISRNCSNSISILNNKLKNFKYDSEPTKGSCNLVNSGSIYSYINKKLNTLKSTNNFNQVDNLDNYVGYDGEVVLYIGETTDKYEHDRFYMYHDGIIEFDDNDLCNNNFNGTKTEPYWEKISDFGFDCNCDIDLANYYNKTEINELLSNISDTNTIYYGSDTISIDENNVLHAIIPTPTTQPVVNDNYYTKQQIDELLNNYGPKYRQGENIIIQNGVISAVLPSQQVNLSKYYKASEVDEIIDGLKDTTYTAGDNIWISENNEINAIVPNVEDFMDNYEIELSSCSPNIHIDRIEEKKEIVTTSKRRTTTTTTIENGEVVTNVEEEDIPGEDVEPISNSDFSKKVKYCIKVDNPNDGTLTIKQGDDVLGSFSANQSTDTTITIPKEEPINVIANNPTLDAGTTKTIGKVNNVDLEVTMPNFVLNAGGIPKIQYVESKEIFDTMTKESNTLYFIPVETTQS